VCRYLKKDNNLEELGVERMIMFNVKEMGWESVHRVNLIIVDDSDTWLRLVYTVLKHRFA
jgi:hypothetical protein